MDNLNMRCASFNVLADAYIGYGDYSHVEASLLASGARIRGIVDLVNRFDADIVGLQEAELPLLDAFKLDGHWQVFWSPKGHDKPDGCLTLVREGINVSDFDTYSYSDNSGHIAQRLGIGKIAFANTHIKWAPIDTPSHIGVQQAKELVDFIGADGPAVIFADCNDQPGGPVRQLIEAAGFTNTVNNEPTAIVDQKLVALDLLSVRGLTAHAIKTGIDVSSIPSDECPSDHVPLLAELQ